MWVRTSRLLATTVLLCAALSLGACFDDDDDGGATPQSYTVGGTLSGLGSGLSVTLLNNGANALTRTANGSFAFSTPLRSGSAYAVTVGTQPPGQSCVVNDGSGTVGNANVTSVTVSCADIPVDKFTIGGTIAGLGSALSVTLQNNGADDLTRSANGDFTFATTLSSGAAYAVTVQTQPTGQTCTVTNGSGVVGVANVTDVAVDCAGPPAWAWRGGSDLVAPAGVYGTKGVPSTANAPGGRNWNGSWVDPTGQFWIFGGQGYDIYHSSSVLNDLWRYSPSTHEWTWMSGSNTINAIGFYGTKGVASGANVPGAREFMVTWVADNGDFWLFGGYGFDGVGDLGYLNDVWRYQPSNGLWTWMGGSNLVNAPGVYGSLGVESATNQPGARWGAVAFQFGSGNLYLFGGYGVDANGQLLGYLNDLWTFNPINGRWTWISGSNTYGAAGVYGTKGVAAPANVPGARSYTLMVPTDNAIWIFGGITVDAANTPVAMNDLWRYDIKAGQWTWVSGASVPNSSGVYGTKGIPAAANVPGARGGMVGWSEPYIWIFGGAGYDSVGNGNTDLNDLWRFDPATGHWTWVSGSNLAGAKGTYGTLGVPSNNNVPGARDSGTVFHDLFYTGHAWLFGGAGYDSTGVYDAYGLNDLWELIME
jgi:N-acetylneuraminic acid mutarotase